MKNLPFPETGREVLLFIWNVWNVNFSILFFKLFDTFSNELNDLPAC